MTLTQYINDVWRPLLKAELQTDWYETVARYHLPVICAKLGGHELESIQPDHARIFASWLLEHKSEAVAHKILTTLRTLTKYLYQTRRTTLDLSVGIRVKPRFRPIRERTLTDHQLDLLFDTAPVKLKPYLMVVRYTGARRKSLLNLQWSDIDFQAETITFRRTKNRKDLTLPLHPKLATYLQELAFDYEFLPYVLPRYTLAALTQAVKRLTAKNSLTTFCLHDLRHVFASRLGNAGVSLSIIQAALGHDDPRSTARYISIDKEPIKSALQKFL